MATLVTRWRSSSGISAATAASSRGTSTSPLPRLLDNPEYTSVVNGRHYDRLRENIEDARGKGGEVIELNPAGEDFSNQQGTQKIPPTLIKNATDDMRVLEEEIPASTRLR